MVRDVELSRRRTIRLAALSGTSALIAGCIDTFDEGTPSEADGSGESESDDGSGAAADPADAAGGDDGDDGDGGDDSDDEATAADVDRRFLLEANVGGWVGVEPDPIEGVENPTLELEPGQPYELGWVNGDGLAHNLQIVDEHGAVVDDLRTPLTTDPEDDESRLEFAAAEEMVRYECDPHRNTMNGRLVVGTDDRADGTEGGEEPPAEIDREAWADVSRIRLVGTIAQWEGVEPAPIEGVENPTLGLVQGREYELVWENGDGAAHDFVIRDDDGETLHATDFADEEGDTRTIAFEATEEMSHYVCRPHESMMNGDIVVFSE